MKEKDMLILYPSVSKLAAVSSQCRAFEGLVVCQIRLISRRQSKRARSNTSRLHFPSLSLPNPWWSVAAVARAATGSHTRIRNFLYRRWSSVPASYLLFLLFVTLLLLLS